MPWKDQLRHYFSDHIQLYFNQLPHKVDLRQQMTPVEDQSRIGSCTANTLAGAYEYILKKTTGDNIDVSRLFVYYNARARKKTPVKDSGCSMTSAIEALGEAGVCLESTWPYDISKVDVRPFDEAYQEGLEHQLTEALKVNIDLTEMKTCLAQGYPFAFGLKLYKSFDKARTTGVVPMPDESEQGRTEHGSHALLAVGYSDQSRAFIVRNSWGEAWGDKGYCYIPYDYMSNPKFCFDAWTVRQIETDDLGHDGWDDDDSVDYQQLSMNNDSVYAEGDDEGNEPRIRRIKVVNDDDDDGTSTSSSSSSSDSDD